MDAYDELCNVPFFMKAIEMGPSYKKRSYQDLEGREKEEEKPKSGYYSGNNLLEMLKTRVSISKNPTQKEVTVAWRKYLRLIHPDLTSNPVEKNQRTAETQILNNLYDEYMKRYE